MVDFFEFIIPFGEKYIELVNVSDNETYDYKARNMFNLPVIKNNRLLYKCKNGESWMYIAIPSEKTLTTLSDNDYLYVGAQTQDRMFRGDGFKGANFHHKEMRAGNASDSLVNYLKVTGSVDIYRFDAYQIEKAILQTECLPVEFLIHKPRTKTKHLGYWFEQYLLKQKSHLWRWNTKSSEL